MPALALQFSCEMIEDPPRKFTCGMSEDRLQYHLHYWTRWMTRRDWRRLWYPSKASGGMGRSHSTDFDEMVDRADNRCARAVDAIINGLPIHERLAIHHKHLAAVYRVRVDLERAYEDGCYTLRRELVKRGIE